MLAKIHLTACPQSLNALSGIGGVRTRDGSELACPVGGFRLNALSGIGGVRTLVVFSIYGRTPLRLNALSGIGGVRTRLHFEHCLGPSEKVLMPCRALEAFRPNEAEPGIVHYLCLNALSGIGGVQT